MRSREMGVWFALLTVFCAPSRPAAAQEPVDGLLNGDFELVLGSGTLGKSQLPVDGGFWVGAEGLTRPIGAERFLELDATGASNRLVYQRVGAPASRAGSAAVTASVRVPSGSEARITLSEGNGPFWMLEWIVRRPFRIFYKEGEGHVRWSAWERDEAAHGTLAPVALTFLQPDGQGGLLQGFTSTAGTGNAVQYGETRLASDRDGYLELRWTAPEEGRVRVLLRPWRRHQIEGPNEDVEHQLWRHSPGPPASDVLLRVDLLEHGDRNGPVVVERVHVEAGDELRLRAVRRWDGVASAQPFAAFHWWPVILYEGRSLTYRFGPDLASVPATPSEVFVDVPVPADSWHAVALRAGADFEQAFGSTPRAPLDLELSAERERVAFDDLACVLDLEPASEAELRAAVLAEARWMRDNVRGTPARPGILDRDGTGWRRGRLESPYVAHGLDIVRGPVQGGSSEGVHPEDTAAVGPTPGSWELLSADYDDDDFADLLAIAEPAAQPDNTSPVGVAYPLYDVVFDAYRRDASEDYPMGVGPAGIPWLLELFARTSDPAYLDRAFALAALTAKHGVIVEDSSFPLSPGRRDMLADARFDIDTGLNQLPLDADRFWGCVAGCGLAENFAGHHRHLVAISGCLRTYAACKLFDAAHGTQRYPPAELDAMRDVCDAAVEAAMDMINPAHPGGFFSGVWQAFHGNFNDNWGNQSTDAMYARIALDALEEGLGGLDPVEERIRDRLRGRWLVDGADFFFPLWEQAAARCELLAADSVRGWPAYVHMLLRQEAMATPPEAIRAQLLRVALASLKYQYADELRDGVWTAGALDRFQLVDISGGNGGGLGAAANFAHGLSLAYAVLRDDVPEEAEHKADIRAWLLAMLRSNQAHFRTQDPYGGPGYGYWRSLVVRGERESWRNAFRAIASFLAALEHVRGPQTPPPPRASIEPRSLLQGPLPRDYTFEVRLPGAPTEAELRTALYERTRIERWTVTSADAAGPRWFCEQLWPAKSILFSAPDAELEGAIRVVLKDVPPPAAKGVRFELTLRTWDEHGQWSCVSSLQEP